MSKKEDRWTQLAAALVAYPGWVLVAVLLASLCAVFLARDVRLDSDPRNFVAQDSPEMELLEEHHEVFGASDTTALFVVNSSSPAEVVAVSGELGDRLAELEGVLDVSSPVHTPLVERSGEGILIRPAFGPEAAVEGSLAERRQRLRTSGLGGSRLMGADGLTALVAARLDDIYSDPYPAGEALERMQDQVDDVLEKYPSATVLQGGVPATRVASLRGMEKDLMLLLPLANLVLALLLWLHFRSFSAVVLPLSAIGLSVLFMAGVVGIRGEDLNPMTQLTPVLLLVIAVADGVHLMARFEEQLRAGLERRAALAAALRGVGVACVLTTATSILAFLSLLRTQMAVLHSFAVITAAGFVFALLINLTLLPAGLARFGGVPKNPSRAWEGFLKRFVRLLVRPKVAWVCVTVGVLLAVGSAGLGKRAGVDFFLGGVLPEDHEVSAGNRLLDEELGGMLPLEIQVRGAPGAVLEPEVLKGLSTLEERVREEGFFGVIGLAGQLRALRQATTGENGVPTSRAQAAQLLLFSELGTPPGGLFLTDPEHSRARIAASAPDRGGRWLQERRERIEAAGDELLGGLGFTTHVTGAAVVSASGFNTLAAELVQGLLLALLVIVVAIGVLFRSWRMALASLLPNALPLLLVLGWYGASGRHLDLFPAVLLTIALGIAVDDTIHLLTRYRQELPQAASHEEAIVRATTQCLGAVLTTSVILICGMGVLVMSSFPANVTSGFLGGLLIALALLCDLFFAPAFLAVLRPGTPGRKEST